MGKPRHAEIAGAGFAGLTAACALARRGWSVRVHERAEALRTMGAGIYIYENGLRVLEAVGAADGANSKVRISLALAPRRKPLADGAIRLLLDKTEAERKGDGGVTVEHWSGTRRILYTPCSETDIYIALTMLDADAAGKAT